MTNEDMKDYKLFITIPSSVLPLLRLIGNKKKRRNYLIQINLKVSYIFLEIYFFHC